MRYRKKLVVIDAISVADLRRYAAKAWDMAPVWATDAQEQNILRFIGADILVATLEGLMFANETDWILKGVKGELYPCKGDIFEMTYEPVDELEGEPA